jgi:hypothetical protein
MVSATLLVAAIAAASFEPVNATIQPVTYRGRPALHVLAQTTGDNQVLGILKNRTFKDGTIEVDLAGTPRPGAPPDSRGFIGIAFRLESSERYECFYIRPTNGRADDQLRRNHTTQYVSEPEFPWHVLRKESPGVYESYVDVEAGAWTRLRIEVAGRTAKLYVNGATQPSLIVNDLKHEGAVGRIALWSHGWTDAYFAALDVRDKR